MNTTIGPCCVLPSEICNSLGRTHVAADIRKVLPKLIWIIFYGVRVNGGEGRFSLKPLSMYTYIPLIFHP